MVLSKRERYILIGVGVAGVALALDQLGFNPLMKGRQQAADMKQSLLLDMDRAQTTLRLGRDLAPKWQGMIRAGVRGDPVDAETQVLQAIHDWARECGVQISLLKPDRLSEKTLLPEINFQAAGTGSMESVRLLLWRLQNATIPLRVTELHLTTRKEVTDDLTVDMRLSTVYLPGAKRPAVESRPASSTTGARR